MKYKKKLHLHEFEVKGESTDVRSEVKGVSFAGVSLFIYNVMIHGVFQNRVVKTDLLLLITSSSCLLTNGLPSANNFARPLPITTDAPRIGTRSANVRNVSATSVSLVSLIPTNSCKIEIVRITSTRT